MSKYIELKDYECEHLPPVLWAIVMDYTLDLPEKSEPMNLEQIDVIQRYSEHDVPWECPYCNKETIDQHAEHGIEFYQYIMFQNYRRARLAPHKAAELRNTEIINRTVNILNRVWTGRYGLRIKSLAIKMPRDSSADLFHTNNLPIRSITHLIIQGLVLYFYGVYLAATIQFLLTIRNIIFNSLIPKYIRFRVNQITRRYGCRMRNPVYMLEKFNIYVTKGPNLKRRITES